LARSRLPGRKAPGQRGRRIKNFCLGGQSNPLKTVVSDKGIQGNASLFLCFSLGRLGRILLDFDRFGFGLATLIQIWSGQYERPG
jgi:hypothetical protein